MANYGDTNAWIRLTYGDTPDYLYLRCNKPWQYGKDDPSATSIDYPSRGHFGFTLNTEKVIIKLTEVYVTTEAEWNILKAQLEAAEEAASCTLRIQISSTPTYELFNGVAGKDEMPILIKSKKAYGKIFKGDTTMYQIKQIILWQIGALA